MHQQFNLDCLRRRRKSTPFQFCREKRFVNETLWTFGLRVDSFKGRFSPESLLTLLTDFDVLAKSRLTIGTMSSNVLEYVYQLRCVDDPAASDRTLSLDSYYNPTLRVHNPTYRVISVNHLYKCDRKHSKDTRSSNTNKTRKWPSNLTTAEKLYLEAYVRDKDVRFFDIRNLSEQGLFKIGFRNSRMKCFYTPFYNLRKFSQVIPA
ncbi:uncharacterized protein LOC142342432 [Convolutriloba macropyga]|uniref:uncharacterized protein LOC142342432 n=1 Tax=Convolutriloba macropyga TaxID=536237 RepID=UPI003F51FEC1